MPTCRYCQAPLTVEPVTLDLLGHAINIQPTVCEPCIERIDAEEKRQAMAARVTQFNAMCPAAYRDTDANRLDQSKLSQVMAWEFGPKGMVLHGPSRAGKTRCVWLRLRKLLVEEGTPFLSMTSGEFGRGCGEAYGTSAEAGRDWFTRLVATPVLFIDDFGKMKLTERVEAELFDVIEHRTSTGKPLLLTTNGVGATLNAMFSPDRGTPIIERIREFCGSVSFGGYQQSQQKEKV